MRALKPLVAAASLLASGALSSFVATAITVNGDFSDWATVLVDPANAIGDGALGAGDLDSPNNTASDLRGFAVTWDADNLYLYFRRGAQSSASISCVAYMDANHDGRMENGEPVLFYNFSNTGFAGFSLRHHVSVSPSGDALGGDGSTPPGSVGASLSANGNGAQDGVGIRYETSVPWSVLASCGVTPRSPMLLHPSISLGTNLPSQIQDNGDLVDTLVQELAISPDGEAAAKPGETVAFSHTVTNGGNSKVTAEISAVSQQGWAVTFWDASGAVQLSDTNGNGTPDTGPIPSEGSVTIIVKVAVPSAVSTQTNDTVTVAARAASNSALQSTATDLIYAGYLVIFSKAQEKSGSPGITVPYFKQIVSNLTDATITLDVSAASALGWAVSIRSDANCDDVPETGPITQIEVPAHASQCLITYVSIPSGASIGATDVTTTTISFGNPLISISVESTTHVSDLFTIAPNSSGSAGAGETIFYTETVSNNEAAGDTINLKAASSLGWAIALYNLDGVTPLADSNGDGVPDTGALPPFGGSFSFKLRLTVPPAAAYNSSDTTTITATSSGLPAQNRQAACTTTVKDLVTFRDAAYSAPASVFSACATVYFKAYGLSSGTYRFKVYDPSSADKTAAPAEMSPDLSGQVSDSYALASSDAVGTWTVTLQKKSGSSWSSLPNYLANFQVAGSGSVAISTGRSTYNLSGETVSVTATASNPSSAPFLGGSLAYVLFIDSNGNNVPDAGETFLLGNGTTAAYSPGMTTHLTSGFSVAAGASASDCWSLGVPSFGTQGQWKASVVWASSCSTVIASGYSAFQVVLDNTPPVSQITAPAGGATLHLSLSPLSIQGTASDTGTYVSKVEVSTDGGVTWALAGNSGTNFSTWSYAWTPFYRGSYCIQSRATDAAGNVETPGQAVCVTVLDDTPPTTPVVTDGGDYTAGVLSASWSSQDPNSGIASYRYCIGTSPGSCDVVPYTAVGLNTSVSRSGLPLVNGTTYYFNVVSTNLDGYDSATGSSNGITADLAGPSSSVTAPSGGQTISGATFTIQGTASDALSGVASVQVSTDGGVSWNATTGAASWSYIWTLPADGSYTIISRATDAVGNLGPQSPPVTVKVDNPPEPPSNLSATPDGNCVVTLAWSPSPASDLSCYAIYNNGGSGAVNYVSPIATVPAGTTQWASSRGIYGYCAQQVGLAAEPGQTANSIASYYIINANKENYTITGASFTWPSDSPQRFVSQVEIGGVTVFSLPAGSPDNNGSPLAFAATTLAPGQAAQLRCHFEYVAGGYPEMTGNSLAAKFATGPGPTITALLQASGQYPNPCRSDNVQSLIVGATYLFGIRAFDLGGQNDGNTTVTIGTAACAPSLSAAIKSPKTGEKIRGAEVTVYAEITHGSLSDVKQVRFQYRPSGGGSWSDMVPASLYHPNPDPASPYFIYWDVNALPAGNYDIQAVATHILGYDDPTPQYITVTVVSSSEDLLEDRDGSNQHFAAEGVTVVSTANRLVVGDDIHDNVTQIWIPQNALSSDTTCTAVIADPALAGGNVPSGWGAALQFREISLASGQAAMANGQLSTIEIPFDDSDNNGIVDGTTTPKWNLALYSWDGATWTPAASSQVDTLQNIVRGQTSHFTLFAPLAQPASSDTVPPAAVTKLKLARSGNDITFTWDPVTLDVNGSAETIHHYNIYRGTVPNFVPDKTNHTNLIGTSATPTFFQANGAGDLVKYFYLVTAVDMGYNEGN